MVAMWTVSGVSWSMPGRFPKCSFNPRAQSMCSVNHAPCYLFEGRFQQCKEPICLALSQENPQLLLFIKRRISTQHWVHLPVSLRMKDWKALLNCCWCRHSLSPSPRQKCMTSERSVSVAWDKWEKECVRPDTAKWQQLPKLGRTNFHWEWPH